MLRRLIAPLLMLALTSCILVEDFSQKWQSGVSDICINKLANTLYFTEFRRNPDGKDMSDYAHVLTIGKEHFLMLKQATTDKGGRMYRFGVVNGIFQRYRLNPVMKAQFLKDYADAPVSFAHDTVTLASLGEPEVKLLGEIATKPEYWEIEDQSLYNTALNPLCRYEDRDLAKMAAENKRKK